MAAIAGLYGGGYGQNQEDGGGGKHGFFGPRKGGGTKGGVVPGGVGGPAGTISDHPSQQQPLIGADGAFIIE